MWPDGDSEPILGPRDDTDTTQTQLALAPNGGRAVGITLHGELVVIDATSPLIYTVATHPGALSLTININ